MMSEQVILTDLQDKIEFLSRRDCEGCKYIYASFSDHTCYVDEWSTKVFKHSEEAFEFVPGVNKFNKNYLFEQLLNGSTND